MWSAVVSLMRWTFVAVALLARPAWASDAENRARVEAAASEERVEDSAREDEESDLAKKEGDLAWSVRAGFGFAAGLQGEFVTVPTWSGRPAFTFQTFTRLGYGRVFRQFEGSHWLGYGRVDLTLTRSLTHGTSGVAGRAGLFVGVDPKGWRLISGLDLWIGVYGTGGFASDYHLPGAMGLDWETQATWKARETVWLTGVARPGVSFSPHRRRQGVLDQLEIAGQLAFTTPVSKRQMANRIEIGLGWRAQWNVAGSQHGPMAAFALIGW